MFTGNASTPIFLKGTSNLDYVTCICALHVYAWACRMPVHIHVVPHTQVDEGGNIIVTNNPRSMKRMGMRCFDEEDGDEVFDVYNYLSSNNAC